jgi:methyl-accepting chemotaxis protein
MKLRLQYKIMLLALLATVLTALTIVIITNITTDKTSEVLIDFNHDEAMQNLNRITKDIYKTCEITDKLINANLEKSLDYMQTIIRRGAGAQFSGSQISWNAVNQFTKDVRSVSLPSLKVGNTNFSQNFSMEQKTPIIDDVESHYEGTYTIFQRMNDQGDMLRIATNVETLDNRRAIGTYIPAINPDGNPNPVLSDILKGKAYKGTAFVVNKWYQTLYRPLKDNSGRVIGMIYAGVSLDTKVPELRKSILDIKIGKTGYVYILKGSGANKGDYLISLKGERDGENILNAQDANGIKFIEQLINESTAAVPGSITEISYAWINPGEDKARNKIVSATYFPAFDWVIGAGIYEEELFEVSEMIEDQASTIFSYTIYATIAIAIVIILISILIANRIARPITESSKILLRIANGDLQNAQKELNVLNKWYFKLK